MHRPISEQRIIPTAKPETQRLVIPSPRPASILHHSRRGKVPAHARFIIQSDLNYCSTPLTSVERQSGSECLPSFPLPLFCFSRLTKLDAITAQLHCVVYFLTVQRESSVATRFESNRTYLNDQHSSILYTRSFALHDIESIPALDPFVFAARFNIGICDGSQQSPI